MHEHDRLIAGALVEITDGQAVKLKVPMNRRRYPRPVTVTVRPGGFGGVSPELSDPRG